LVRWKFFIFLIVLAGCDIYSNDTVYLPRDLVDELNQLYINNNDVTEIAFCLTGDDTFIYGFRPAIIRHSEWDGAGFECKMSDVADLHTHPEHDCRMSYDDIVESQKDSTYAAGIICDVNKYVFWRNGNFTKVYIVERNGTFTDITFETILAE